jgi:hypothetical protein
VRVSFKIKHEWALLPHKHQVDRHAAALDAGIYARNFRWFRKTRTAAACWPWRVAQELGWVIPSPVDVHMTPLRDVEVACMPEEMELLSRATRLEELWKRSDSYLAVETTNWLRLYDVRGDGGWEAMFVPNGDGTVEWHLGWEAHIPEGYFLMILPPPDSTPGLDVPMGLLDFRTLCKLNEKQGVAIAVKPTLPVTLRRHQPVARLVLLHPDSIKATMAPEESPGEGDK